MRFLRLEDFEPILLLRIVMPEIIVKSKDELVLMRRACRLASQTLEEAGKLVKPGACAFDIDEFIREYTEKHHAKSACINYCGYPRYSCISINEVVCHGIPNKKMILKDGDIVNIDITSILDGWHGDVSATFYVGTPSKEAVNLVETTRQCLAIGIEQVHPGARLGDIGAAIQAFAEGRGFSVVRDYVGHGIGREFHEDLQVAHYGRKGHGIRLVEGMTFTIEPMINAGDWRIKILDDGWTSVTKDGKWSAQFEHTLVVTKDGCEVMTAFSGPLANSVTPSDFHF